MLIIIPLWPVRKELNILNIKVKIYINDSVIPWFKFSGIAFKWKNKFTHLFNHMNSLNLPGGLNLKKLKK